MKPQRWTTERLDAALKHVHAQAQAEDCIRRLENRALVVKLDQASAEAQHEANCNIIRCWAGDQV